MKELSIKEKAKRYDEALWKAGELYQPSYSALLEEIFPELIKYNNEKVRGAIIHFISHTPTVPIGRINKETMLTWLEKQGQVNETIISQHENKICKENNDSLTSEDARIKKYLLSMFSDPNDSWDGISAREIIAWLEKQGNPTDINPSEFDLRLNKLLKQFETLPKEELASSLSFYLNVVQNDGTYREEKQGERNLTLPKWKYKKDNTPLLRDSIILNKYGCVAKSPSGALVSDVWVLDYAELAKLPKEEIEKHGEQKLAWSEEDKKRIQRISDFIWKNRKGDTDDIYQQEQDVKWLKSLRPQKQWKPSDEQMADLWNMLCECRPADHQLLQDIYYGLKKLREE